MNRPPLGLLVVLALLATGTAATSAVGGPARHRSGPELVDVVGATAVCPDLRQGRGLIQTRVSVGVEPPVAGSVDTGGVIESIPVSGTPTVSRLPLTQPGSVAVGLGTNLNGNGLKVAAYGPLASGLEVEQVQRGVLPSSRGLAGVRCAAPTAQAWFLGASTRAVDFAFLVLANVEDTPATVDVSEFSYTGPVDPRPGEGITVAPHTRLIVPLDTLAPDRSFLAVHVVSRRGRVVAALLHRQYARPLPLGFDWVPQQRGPATSVFVPGFPAGPGGRYLMVANPGGDDTTVSVRVTTDNGQFVPTGLDAVHIPAGTTMVVYVSKLALSGPLGVTVTSSGAPILAGGLIDDIQTGQPVKDLAYTAATEPLTGAALITDVVIDRPTESTLLLSAPDAPARVVVTPIPVLGTAGRLPAPRTVVVPAGRTVAFRLSTFFAPGTTTRLAVEVRPLPGSGPVYAARYLREHGAHGPLSTLLDLQGPAQQVEREPAVEDPYAGY